MTPKSAPAAAAPARGEEGSLTVAAVARRIGVAPSTLRTWDRRYGLGPSSHDAGAHRRYSEEDVALLLAMRKLVIMGTPPMEAAAQVKANGASAIAPSMAIAHPVGCENDLQMVEILHRAAKAFDRDLLETLLRREIERAGTIHTWNCVMVPLLTEIGQEWEATGSGIEVEHFLSELLKRVLFEPIAKLKEPKNAKPVLLACVGEEIHSLALRALAASLAEQGIDSQFLGARTPQLALNEVVRRSAPPAIFLWAQLHANADLEFIHGLPALRPAPRVIVGGPGWIGMECNKALHVANIAEATAAICEAVGLSSTH